MKAENFGEFVVVEDFLTPEEAKQMADTFIAGAQKDEGDTRHGYANYPLFGWENLDVWFDFDPNDKISAMVDYCIKFFTERYPMEGSFRLDRSGGILMSEGAWLPAHADQDMDEEGNYIGGVKSYICSMLLNDDYDGGELYFDELLKYTKPKAGSLVLFPGYCTRHGVRAITKGTRITVLSVFHEITA